MEHGFKLQAEALDKAITRRQMADFEFAIEPVRRRLHAAELKAPHRCAVAPPACVDFDRRHL